MQLLIIPATMYLIFEVVIRLSNRKQKRKYICQKQS
jgi:hypothetical protein